MNTDMTWRDEAGNVDVERDAAAYEAMADMGADHAAMADDHSADDALPY